MRQKFTDIVAIVLGGNDKPTERKYSGRCPNIDGSKEVTILMEGREDNEIKKEENKRVLIRFYFL